MSALERRRVVVTGIGPVTPVGTGVDAFWQSITAGRSGVGKLEAFDTSEYPSRIAAEVHDFRAEDYMEAPDARRMERFAQFAVAAAQLAVRDAQLDPDRVPPERVGVVIGTGIGGISAFESQASVLAEKGPTRINPRLVSVMIPNMAAAQVARTFGFTGPNDCTTTACAASGHGIARAVELIRSGAADVCVAGGSEAAITPLTLAGFCSARALSKRNDDPEGASRPFDAGRDGFVLGEGAAALVLEEREAAEARGARVYAEISGFGMSSDAYHETAPHPEGAGAVLAMRAALADAGAEAFEVGYVNAHGTSTPLGDSAEVAAIRRVFGEDADRLAVSSTKSVTGHLIGAAGAAEAAATVLAIARGVLPPTINYETPDPTCDVDVVPNVARQADPDVAVSNSFGFGGQNVSLVFRRCP